MNRKRIGIVFSGFLACVTIVGHPSAAQGDVVAEMRHKLVSIQVRDESTTPNKLKEGTGFLASREGFIVTSTHLFDAFGSVALDSLKISISISDNDPLHNKKAFIVESRPGVGVALLKTPSGDEDYQFVTFGTTNGLQAGSSALSLSGFVTGQVAPQTVPTYLSSKDSSNARTWVVSTNLVDPGSVGGPVFSPLDGKVVGIIDSVKPSGTEFVPIELASSVLIPLQLSSVLELMVPAVLDKRIGDGTSNFLSQQLGRDLLTAWLRSYLAGAGNSDIEDYIKRNATKLEGMLDTYMQHYVNYSYNDTFVLATQGGLKSHEFPFYKADGDRGDLSCEAKYPSNPNSKVYPNKIIYTFNDNPTEQHFGLSQTRPSNIVKKFDKIAKENASLYDPARPANTLSPYHVISFTVEDTPAIDGTITVQCTLVIIGAAKYD
jgi:hypothetical protein